MTEAVSKSNQVLWERNHDVIEKAFFDLLTENKKVPSYNQIAKRTGISRQAVSGHMKELNIDIWKPQFRMFTPKILTKLAAEAMNNGRADHIKLFMQLIENFEGDEKKAVTAIQVNYYLGNPNKAKEIE